MANPWRERKRPNRLERRYDFPDYPSLRDFLDRAADLSERDGMYPDMGFGRDYLNVTIYPEDASEALNETRRRFAERLDELYSMDARVNGAMDGGMNGSGDGTG